MLPCAYVVLPYAYVVLRVPVRSRVFPCASVSVLCVLVFVFCYVYLAFSRLLRNRLWSRGGRLQSAEGCEGQFNEGRVVAIGRFTAT